MELRERLTRLARLAGRDAFLAAVGSPVTLHELSPEQIASLQRLVNDRLDAIIAGLLEEAAASDDVLSRGAAEAFIADRLAEFGDLLSKTQVQALAEATKRRLKTWA